MLANLKWKLRKIWMKIYKNYGYKDRRSNIAENVIIYKPQNLYLYEHTGIGMGSVIMNWRAKFVMKRYSGAAFGLKVVTGSHMRVPGKMFLQVTDEIKEKMDATNRYDKDVIVEEDVWIGSNVTLLGGTHIGRGSNIGSGSVVRGNIPPYAVVIGNPAKVVGFTFTPEQIVEHEKQLYPEEERIPLETLEKNYQKYFLKRVKEIRDFTRI